MSTLNRPATPASSALNRIQSKLSWLTLRQFFRALGWGFQSWLGFALLAASFCGVAYAWNLSWAYSLAYTCGATLTFLLLTTLLIAWKRTPTFHQLAVDLETTEPAFRGSLFTCIESFTSPGKVSLSTAELSAEMAVPVLESFNARQLPSPLTREQRLRAHLYGLTGCTTFLLALGVFGSKIFDFQNAAPQTFLAENGETPPQQVVSAPVLDARAPRPNELRLEILIEPPAYSSLPAQWVSDASRRVDALEVLCGSRLTVLASVPASSAIERAILELIPKPAQFMKPLPEDSGRQFFRGTLLFENIGTHPLKIHVGATRILAVHVVEDLAPVVAAEIPESAIPRADGLPVKLDLADDFGLAKAALKLRRLKGTKDAGGLSELQLEIPLPQPGPVKKINAEWRIPREGLERWMEEGFGYCVEATDFATPNAHQSKSEWKTWKPQGAQDPAGGNSGLLEREGTPRPRSLARPNASGANLQPATQNPDQDSGNQSAPPKQLRRPGTEKLEDPHARGNNTNGPQANANPPKSAGGKPQEGESGYEKGPGLKNPDQKNPGADGKSPPAPEGNDPDKKSKAPPQDSSGGNVTSGNPVGKSEGAAQSPEEPHKTSESPKGPGTGEQLRPLDPDHPQGGAAPQGGEGSSNGSSGGSGGKSGQSGSDGGKEKGEGAGAGTGPKRPRDGGIKTGRETGTGDARMAAPDANSLARMKGISLTEALEYAAKHRVAPLDTGFGAARDFKNSGDADVNGKQQKSGFDAEMATHRDPVSTTPTLTPKWETIDPAYRPLIEAYLRRISAPK